LKERGRGEREREREKGWASGQVIRQVIRQAGIFKVRLGLGQREGEKQRYREIERHRNEET
jgi:hypothetical protein